MAERWYANLTIEISMRATFIAIFLIAFLCEACRDEKAKKGRDEWMAQSTCVAFVPAGDEKSTSRVSSSFRSNRIPFSIDGSGVWSFCVPLADAERARKLLRTNADLVVVAETNGIVEVRHR